MPFFNKQSCNRSANIARTTSNQYFHEKETFLWYFGLNLSQHNGKVGTEYLRPLYRPSTRRYTMSCIVFRQIPVPKRTGPSCSFLHLALEIP
jgi:hypothetical protein